MTVLIPRPQPDWNQSWAKQIITRVEVGSTAHGTGLEGKEDYDEIGIFAEPWQHTLGISKIKETVVYRPGRTNEERSGPGDYDLTMHAARKWAHLTAQGNPSMLMLLFGPVVHQTNPGRTLRDNPGMFYSDKARKRFLGYSRAQRERLLGIRGGRHVKRDELVNRHGYDTKYAMHMVRLGFQGLEYIDSGRLILPMPRREREICSEIRRGEWPLEEVIALADENEKNLKALEGLVNPEPEYEVINEWLRDVAGATW